MKCFALGLVLICSCLNAQDFTMKNGSATTCFGQFFDSGGSDGYYPEGEDIEFVLNSAQEGAVLELRFIEFSLNGNDWLEIYDGNTKESPLIGKFNSKNPIQFNIKASSGSLTFVFHSEKGSSGPGWQAKIVCMQNGQKVSRENMLSGKYILRFSIAGLKSPKDARLIEGNLSENEMIRSIRVSFKNSNVWVGVDDENLSGVVSELIAASEEFLGYPLQVLFIASQHSKEIPR